MKKILLIQLFGFLSINLPAASPVVILNGKEFENEAYAINFLEQDLRFGISNIEYGAYFDGKVTIYRQAPSGESIKIRTLNPSINDLLCVRVVKDFVIFVSSQQILVYKSSELLQLSFSQPTETQLRFPKYFLPSNTLVVVRGDSLYAIDEYNNVVHKYTIGATISEDTVFSGATIYASGEKNGDFAAITALNEIKLYRIDALGNIQATTSNIPSNIVVTRDRRNYTNLSFEYLGELLAIYNLTDNMQYVFRRGSNAYHLIKTTKNAKIVRGLEAFIIWEDGDRVTVVSDSGDYFFDKNNNIQCAAVAGNVLFAVTSDRFFLADIKTKKLIKTGLNNFVNFSGSSGPYFYDGKFYYNDGKSIFSMDMSGDRNTVYADHSGERFVFDMHDNLIYLQYAKDLEK